MSLSVEQINEIKQLWESDTYIDLLFFDKIATAEEKMEVERDSIFLTKNDFPEWDPHGPPQLLGGEWVRITLELKNQYVKKKLAKYKKEIKKAICDKFDYCMKRNDQKFQTEEVNLAIAVADSLMSFSTGFPLPIFLVSVYLVKNKMLDYYCRCKK